MCGPARSARLSAASGSVPNAWPAPKLDGTPCAADGLFGGALDVLAAPPAPGFPVEGAERAALRTMCTVSVRGERTTRDIRCA